MASKPSLRTELLANLAFLAAAALVLAVVSALLATPLRGLGLGVLYLVVLLAADVAVFIAFGRHLVARLITRPMDDLVAATEAVAAGELQRRAPPAPTRELDRLAASINRMTARLLDTQRALARAEKLASVGRLAAGVAHEVGNPLAAIANFVEVLRRRGADPEIIAALERESARIDAIVRSLLDYSRPHAATREPVDVGRVVAEAIELLRSQGVFRSVELSFRAADPLPSVNADRRELEQVFVNLLLNAADAAGSGGRVVVVAGAVELGTWPDDAGSRRSSDPAEASHHGERALERSGRNLVGQSDGARGVEVLVADSGPGVPEELAERIFDPFFTTKPPGQGTGLGLAIVQRTVHDHGGRVDVSTSREGGAAFAVTLPAAGA